MANKILFEGESGSGKTCALASLLDAGYNVRVLDTDNKIDVLLNILGDSKSRYKREALSRLAYIKLFDPMRFANGLPMATKSVIWPGATQMLTKWENKDAQVGTVCDLGPLETWTENDVLVIDTVSSLARGALTFHLAINGFLGKVRTQNEARRDVGAAQQYVRVLMQTLAAANIRCHVICNTHITYVRKDGSGELTPGDNAPTQGFPSAIGRALSPELPGMFDSVLMADSVGSGVAVRRKIYTVTRGNINLKNVAPLRVRSEYDQETGLAEYFKDVKGVPQAPVAA